MQETQEMWVRSLGWEDPLEEGMATHSSILTWRIPWTEKPGGLTVHSVTQSWTQLKQLSMHTCACCYQGVIASRLSKLTGQKKAVAPHSSTLAWKIPWTEEPGRLQSMGLLTVGHDWVTSLWLFTFMHWRRKWQPTPVFLPGEPQGWGSLMGCRLWGRTESDTTEVT